MVWAVAIVTVFGSHQRTSGPECATPRAGWIWCDDFETDRTASYYEYDRAGGNFVREAGIGLNGSTAMHAHYVAGAGPDFGYLHLAIGKTPSAHLRPVDAGTATVSSTGACTCATPVAGSEAVATS
jgi:hypothetical protein